MIKKQRQQAGIGLLELFLVLIVGAGILYFSIQQYLVYKHDNDIMQVKYNVDTLFQAMSRYFRANCNISSYSHPDTEILRNASQQNLVVTIADLKKGGYLTENLPISPLLDYSTSAQGYIMQFNQVPSQSRTIQLSSTSSATIGNIILWKAQVSVLLNNPKTATQYQQLLQADCLSQAATGTNPMVTPCSGAAPPANQVFAVFTRLPSLPSETANSTYWQTNPAVKQFTQMYTTDPILVLTDGTQSGSQDYVCGS